MLLKSKEIILPVSETIEIGSPYLKRTQMSKILVSDSDRSLTSAIGLLENGKEHHYYSHGNFNLVRLICYLLKQTGPAHVMLTSYSFSRESIEQLQNRVDKKAILSFKVILDNRVRVMSPLPFQMIAASFDYRCISVHAKIALIWNDDWKITIITSQNATDNPKLERGVIFTDPEIFDFDYQNLCDEFERGTT
jgi:hypothetical protein